MKKIFSTLLLSFSIFFVQAQFSLTPKTNDKLIYDVNAGGSEYNFTVKIKSLNPGFNFVWQMTNESGDYGAVKINATAMATSKKMYNYFRGGDETLKDATSVILSKAAYLEIITKKKVTLWDGDKKITFEHPDETDFTFTIDGEEKTVKGIYIAAENGNDMVVLKNPAYPLILRMNLGWTIKLNTIIPATKTTTDLSSYIDKRITDDFSIWNKLDRSAVITTEDLTGVGINPGPSVYKEYFSHIEGLWVKTHNDTVTDIIYYPTAITHSYHTYYGGDISIPQLSAYNFNRATAKAYVKTKFINRSSYDTDIYQATYNNTMELYYHVPKKTSNGIEFGTTDEKTPKTKQQLAFITFQKK